jgi:hypothetical protein
VLSRGNHAPLAQHIDKRLLVRLAHDALLRNLAGLEVMQHMAERARRLDVCDAMAARVLFDDDAALEESRHVARRGNGRDGVGVVVDEENGVAGLGLLEACEGC